MTRVSYTHQRLWINLLIQKFIFTGNTVTTEDSVSTEETTTGDTTTEESTSESTTEDTTTEEVTEETTPDSASGILIGKIVIISVLFMNIVLN